MWDKFKTSWKGTAQALLLVLAGLGGAGAVPVEDPNAVTPEEIRFGWAGPNELPAESGPQFHVTSAPADYSTAGGTHLLWDYSKAINGGKHFPSLRQETGDCVSFGFAQGMNYHQAFLMGAETRYRSWRQIYPPYIYGISRVNIGQRRLGREAGSLGIWAVKGAVQYGMLPSDAAGVPTYRGSVADAWGYDGPPTAMIELAKQFPMRSYAQVSTYEQARDALCNGYPVTVASSRGFRNGQEVEKSGVLWGVASGNWYHQMVFIGVDDTLIAPDGSHGGLYCLNSWGASAHRAPIHGEPPGGFWVSAKVAEAMLRQDDSWALSGFDGFPYMDTNGVDLSAFSLDVEFPEQAPAEVVLSEEIGVPQPVSGAVGGVSLLAAAAVRRRRKSVMPQAA